MIANITSGSNFFGVANYNQQKVEQGRGEVLYSQGFINTHPRTIDYTLRNYNNSRTQKPVFHVSLSFSEKDKHLLNDKKLLELTKEYLEKMGYKKQPYVVYRHDDTKHPHVHIVTTRVDIEAGKRIPAYREGIRSKAITDQLEKQYGLTVADSRSNQIKAGILIQVSNTISENKPESIEGLNKALAARESNIRAKTVKNGTVYFLVDKQGKRQAGTYKSSQFKDTSITHKNLQKQFQNNYQNRQTVKAIVQNSLPQKGKIPQAIWIAKLESKGVKPHFHEGKKGVYGISFQYHDHVYKGSALNRSLSFGNIKDKLIFPNDLNNNLTENLKEAFTRRESIVKTDPYTGNYITSNPQLNEQLNSLHRSDSKDVVTLHNTHVELSVGIDLNKFTKAMDGYEKDSDERILKSQRRVLQHKKKIRIGR